MRIDAAPRPRRRLSMTSLIDVIFLLLLFFMLSSTFARFAEIEVSGGVASAVAAGERPDVLLRFDGAEWVVNGLPVADDALEPELARLSEAGAQTAVLLVRGELTSQDLITAVERIGGRTALRLTVAR
ncbi:biopolymer transporter ExbD [Chelativorans sp. ZYF759]|jgi:biopolymer transport protein ExbD|uniref:biopolymer transporter ExbD n=1 Tax=Chelativorans sp. ZYF759 TaxID=2692213 RepID=UPI00145E79CE|nr:biopolymer transporter ExbD [Chelativorans sp. ZYF759]NMG41786.1 biopolymer transporter ExbD [Chelativorans sp. ZYF759]